MSNVVAIVGRPNVGKSTFFNRLVEKRQAIMDNMPGVTRDRHYGSSEWNGKFFTIIDTGGYVTGSEDKFESQIRKQVEMAIDESSAVIFMVDCKDGVTGYDKEFANIIRRSKKPVFVAANKADSPGNSYIASQFYELGLGEVYAISSSNGSGSGELLDAVVKTFPEVGVKDPHEGIPRIAIIGRPNVGKSSLLNALLGAERTIVTDEAGTTRDAIHTRYNQYGKDFILIDTAGIRKRAKVHENVEFYSTLRALNALEECDVCIMVIDAERRLEAQDVHIISQAEKMGKGIILFVNKWDLIEKDTKTSETFKKEMIDALKPIDYLPAIFGSATNKQRIFQVMETAVEVYNRKAQKVATSALNDALLPEIAHYPPPSMKGKYIQIKYITQVHTPTPSFAFFCNHPQYIQESYQRFLENRLREKFNFEGVPVRLFFRKK
jgi:GTPase